MFHIYPWKREVTMSNPRLTTISEIIPNSFLHSLSSRRRCKALTALKVSECVRLDDACVEATTSGCNSLRVIDVSFCFMLTNAAFEHLAWRCALLEELDASFVCHLGDVGVCALALACRSLKVNRINKYKQVKKIYWITHTRVFVTGSRLAWMHVCDDMWYSRTRRGV